MSGMYPSDFIAVNFPFTESDIGGTNTAGSFDTAHWLSMEGYEWVMAKVELGTWNASDDLDTCKLQQASDSVGTGVKDLTTASATGNYDTSTPIDADGNWVILEARAADFDVTNGFKYVRVYCAETGDTGTDNVSAVVIRGGGIKRDALNGADSSGVYVYVKPS